MPAGEALLEEPQSSEDHLPAALLAAFEAEDPPEGSACRESEELSRQSNVG